MRRLVHVAVVHSAADMGSMSETVRRAHIDKYGEETWRKSRDDIAALWRTIEKRIDDHGLDLRKVRLYQDGLPVCGHEEAIVRELAEKGGPNHRILVKLMEGGAAIEGTEDPELLLQEYALIKATLSHASGGQPRPSLDSEGRFRDLLARRDKFIAARIDQTLRCGETAILFLGALHNVLERLPREIEVRSLLQA